MKYSHELIACLAVLAMYTFVILFKYLLTCTHTTQSYSTITHIQPALRNNCIFDLNYNLEFEYAMNCKCEPLLPTRQIYNQTSWSCTYPMQNTEFINVAHTTISNLAGVELHLTNI
ncbi:Hypothetical_protein [Hexamita inflata]|uniref:Hypothetical_protein n=1 Tax=Hexamita inflata TaxID=28002 RepID=A0AA86TY46_9EUKA|nr:Hypothetical protein HINF_LOCUS12663 [Hexamita inflata]